MKTEKIFIDPNQFKDRMFTTSEIGRGVGVHKSKKGKGSYTRRAKHRSQYSNEDNYTGSYLSL